VRPRMSFVWVLMFVYVYSLKLASGSFSGKRLKWCTLQWYIWRKMQSSCKINYKPKYSECYNKNRKIQFASRILTAHKNNILSTYLELHFFILTRLQQDLFRNDASVSPCVFAAGNLHAHCVICLNRSPCLW